MISTPAKYEIVTFFSFFLPLQFQNCILYFFFNLKFLVPDSLSILDKKKLMGKLFCELSKHTLFICIIKIKTEFKLSN